MARVKDILDDGGRFSPMALVVGLAAFGCSAMIVWNALFHQPAFRIAAGEAPSQQTPSIQIKYDAVVEEAQRELLALNLYSGPVNGVMGLPTRDAIMAYQQLNGMERTGVLTPQLLTQIKFAHKVQTASRFTGSVAPAQPPAQSGTVVYESAHAVASAKPNKPDDQTIKKVQVALAGLGYEIKKMDGQVSAETRSAILKYEMDNGLDMNGVIDKGLMDALKVQ